LLFQAAASNGQQRRKRSAWVSRQLRLLRAHGIRQKVLKTHRYQVTEPGRKALTAILSAWNAKVSRLTALAA